MPFIFYIGGKIMIVRKLNGSDIFKVSKILKKIGLKNEISKMVRPLKEGQEKDDVAMDIGIELMVMIIENIHMAEKEIFDLLGNLVCMSAEELANKDTDYLLDLVEELKNSEDIMGFFKRVGKLMSVM